MKSKSLAGYAVALLCATSFGKDLNQRVGLGAVFHDLSERPSISVRYHLTPYFSVSFLYGFDNALDKRITTLGGRAQRNLSLEENMNVYIAANGLVVAGSFGLPNVATGLEVDGVLGAELFLSGLPNLGFHVEGGVGARTLRGNSLRSVAGAGVHYHF